MVKRMSNFYQSFVNIITNALSDIWVSCCQYILCCHLFRGVRAHAELDIYAEIDTPVKWCWSGRRNWWYYVAAAAAAKSLQSCPTLCNPIDGSSSGSPVPGILQARTLEWVAISFSNAWKWKVKAKSLSRVRLFVTPWTAAYQAPPSMGFSRQEYWNEVPLPSLKLC